MIYEGKRVTLSHTLGYVQLTCMHRVNSATIWAIETPQATAVQFINKANKDMIFLKDIFS